MVEMEDLFLIFYGSYLSRSLHKQNSFTPRKCRRHHFYIHCYISSCLQSVLHKIKKKCQQFRELTTWTHFIRCISSSEMSADQICKHSYHCSISVCRRNFSYWNHRVKSSCEIICNIGKFVFERIVQVQLKLYGNQFQLTFAPVGKSWLFWHQNADKGFNQYTSQKEPKTKFDW